MKNFFIGPYELRFARVNFSICDTVNNNTRKYLCIITNLCNNLYML